jgi:hypothetical protein
MDINVDFSKGTAPQSFHTGPPTHRLLTNQITKPPQMTWMLPEESRVFSKDIH